LTTTDKHGNGAPYNVESVYWDVCKGRTVSTDVMISLNISDDDGVREWFKSSDEQPEE